MSIRHTRRVTTALGAIDGVALEGHDRFRGIRYAAPPVGRLRFMAPQDPEGWSGVCEAFEFGASAPQPDRGGPAQQSEDCLYLNIYTPRADGESRRPVMVWIHGGSYTTGSGDLFDGQSFCRHDVVVVTINYRLGPLGFLPLRDLDDGFSGSANNGIRDQMAALRWVREHIASFGGDPANVTVFGESAGAGSILALLAAPEARGLFQKAILQSPPAEFRHEEHSTVRAVLDELQGGIEYLRSAPVDELLGVAARAAAALVERPGRLELGGFGPVVDGVVIPVPPTKALETSTVPLIAGTNRDEGTLFAMSRDDRSPEGRERLRIAIERSGADPDRVLAAYERASRPSGQPLTVEVTGDRIFRIPTLRAIDAQVTAGSAPAWVYLFAWSTSAFGGRMGAMHALEIPFVWNGLRQSRWAGLTEGAPQHLADGMHRSWIAFAHTGDPNHRGLANWPEYDTVVRPTMVFDVEPLVVDDPRSETRSCW